ncbi:hypothetical protein BVG16_02170 [Paenibacillus selenitireducens]|jgi:hypothetical protein|uniref:DUF4309 domain-containing protein n=1 Tax=Paenibacillus selenitireducens TaxID=1324314 RepID=A0A1T2XMX3_9BACL|nr:hypothetical protein [Paenibacillus selenitireducens]OPA81162.1 hypothetical protein BVG16_02170 [Paenibacillus selenitireducens]
MNFTYRKACIALVLFTVVLSGCGSKSNEASAPTQVAAANAGSDANSQQGSTDLPTKSTDTKDVLPQSGKNKLEISSSKEAGNAPSKDKSNTPKSQGKKVDEPAFDPEHPKLCNIALFDTKDSVVKKLGKPTDQYTMDNEDSPLQVYEYQGFTVGFHPSHGVEFIEVSDKGIATGLRGIRVNNHADHIIKALGKPNSETEYVISYEAKDGLLKIDIDPMTRLVQSIKLFSTKAV